MYSPALRLLRQENQLQSSAAPLTRVPSLAQHCRPSCEAYKLRHFRWHRAVRCKSILASPPAAVVRRLSWSTNGSLEEQKLTVTTDMKAQKKKAETKMMTRKTKTKMAMPTAMVTMPSQQKKVCHPHQQHFRECFAY